METRPTGDSAETILHIIDRADGQTATLLRRMLRVARDECSRAGELNFGQLPALFQKHSISRPAADAAMKETGISLRQIEQFARLAADDRQLGRAEEIKR